MKLLTKEIEELFANSGDLSEKSMEEITVICKFFNPVGVGTWWLYERLDDDVFMAFVLLDDPMFAELGTVSLSELESLKLPLGLGIERDLSFKPTNLKEIYDKVKERK